MVTSFDTFEVRPLRTGREFRACEGIQQEVWGHLACSAELLSTAQKHGGVVLGAFHGRELAGFLFAFLARRRGKLIHWSHMMAVRENLRDHGLGLRMKLLHRRLAIEQGLRSICWTFDPLESRNAFLNIERLGAVVEEYIPDCYGDFPSVIEKGLPSDRLVANWRITSRAVARALQRVRPTPRLNPRLPRINETISNSDGFPKNARIRLNRSERRLAVEIPADTDGMRSAALSLARRWRTETRPIFQTYFAAGYRVTGFARDAGGSGRCFYVMTRSKQGD
ncbi:MAG: hypothetical protein ACRD1O_10210 [Terriglobia bacterium]